MILWFMYVLCSGNVSLHIISSENKSLAQQYNDVFSLYKKPSCCIAPCWKTGHLNVFLTLYIQILWSRAVDSYHVIDVRDDDQLYHSLSPEKHYFQSLF